MSKYWIIVGAVLCIFINTGCAKRVVVYGQYPAPAPRVEKRGCSPCVKAVWVPGYWHWNRRCHCYVWVKGHWKGCRQKKLTYH